MIQFDSRTLKNYNFLVKYYIELSIKKFYNNYTKYLRTKIYSIREKR